MKRYSVTNDHNRTITFIEHGKYRFRIVDRTADPSCKVEKFEVDIDRTDVVREEQFVGNGVGNTRKEAMREAVQSVRDDVFVNMRIE